MKPRWNQIFSKAKFLKKVDKSLINHRNKHYDTVEYIDCHLHFKLRGKAVTSKVLKKVTIKLKLLYPGVETRWNYGVLRSWKM